MTPEEFQEEYEKSVKLIGENKFDESIARASIDAFVEAQGLRR